MLKIEHLAKNYGKKQAVQDISLSVQPGEIYGFLGPNGAGKTTTIKVCTGLLKPTSGSVFICGHDIAHEPLEAKRQFGYVPENPYLYEKLTGREFLHAVLQLHGTDGKKAGYKRIDELLEQMKMSDDADQLIGTYSHGMRRKITICAAFSHWPSVIFLDEPTTGLDAAAARNAKDLFRSSADQGAAVMFTTHVLEIAERLCDRIGIIYRGSLVAEGTLDELKQKARQSESTLEDIFLRLTEA